MQNKLIENIASIGISETGCVRDHNEDSILVDKELGLMLVADGMGGHQAGEIASKEAIKIIHQMLLMKQRDRPKKNWFLRLYNKIWSESSEIEEKELYLDQAMCEANHHIYQLNLERNALNGTGMGTTIAGCWLIAADTMLVFHIGDSRVYRFRNQKLEGLTKDHSILQEWHNNGCIGEKPGSNVILNAVGPFPETAPEIQVVSILESDAFLICSDGLTDMVQNNEIEEILYGLEAERIGQYSQNLLAFALQQGGKDNVSIILVMQSP